MTRPLACPKCGTPYAPDDVHAAQGLAGCRPCDKVYPLGRAKEPAVQPVRWTRAEEGGGLVLRNRWFGLQLLFLVPWCLIWDSAIVGVAFAEPAAVAILAFHGVAGLVVSWYTLCTFVNTTTITVRGGQLELAHGPLWWPGGTAIPTAGIDQLYVERSNIRKNKRPTWHVVALGRDGVGIKVSPLLTSIAEGRWIEQEIEAHLAIDDRPMANEA